MLASVEHNFGLASLTARDATAADLTDLLNYNQDPIKGFQLPLHPLPSNMKPVIIDGLLVNEGESVDDDD